MIRLPVRGTIVCLTGDFEVCIAGEWHHASAVSYVNGEAPAPMRIRKVDTITLEPDPPDPGRGRFWNLATSPRNRHERRKAKALRR